MSQESVELVREGFARWNEGDYDFFFNSTTPDIELLSRFGSLTGEPYRGHRGVREWHADIQQSFERFELWLDDVRVSATRCSRSGVSTCAHGEAGST